ncbi:hypothetical protein SMACR_00352 [Sordaria macrospora]|uniref:WGS project CABT00000000 data, contig 2.1 n=2 Tax=Sordaria macrospora TaxID=5147 RepID=F7VKV9_SORMK|nr:uncharacterized protein SMAC_00352 [Sordaria macrospora k-hell]KAA8627811.1 hypothetical protein SMACR_00352 [Sordaria macrospora]CCC06136.1 unnamed protein product [Sordaria macrospora k-hell]
MSESHWVDWNKNTQSKDYRGSGSFSTFIIIGPVCFFLGILFAQFPYDFPLLWTSEPAQAAYYDFLEAHVKFLHASPPTISRILNILFRPAESNVLFDGASLILYVIGVGVYTSNIVKGMRTITAGIWDMENFAGIKHDGPVTGEVVLGREDTMKVLSASNTILAMVLVGVLVLQAGQWYAESKEKDDFSKGDKKEKKTGGQQQQQQQQQQQGQEAEDKKSQ